MLPIFFNCFFKSFKSWSLLILPRLSSRRDRHDPWRLTFFSCVCVGGPIVISFLEPIAPPLFLCWMLKGGWKWSAACCHSVRPHVPECVFPPSILCWSSKLVYLPCWERASVAARRKNKRVRLLFSACKAEGRPTVSTANNRLFSKWFSRHEKFETKNKIVICLT